MVLKARLLFGRYGGSMYIYGHMENGEKTLQQVEKEQKNLKMI